jgi:hypothetical protein
LEHAVDEFETRAGDVVSVSSAHHEGVRRIVLASTDRAEDVTSVVLLSTALARSIAMALLRAVDEIEGVTGRA